jgi:excisionase family DNA binding protein
MVNPQASLDTCSTREAAKLLGVSIRTAQLWVEQGRLRAWKTPGGHRRILRQSVDAVLARRHKAAATDRRAPEILIVEDDPIQLHALEARVVAHCAAASVRTAPGGVEGLLRMGECHPDLLITDLMMPGLDGLRMLQSLANGRPERTTQIVVVTAMEAAELAARGGVPAGITVLHKPVSEASLTAILDAVCRERAGAAPACY